MKAIKLLILVLPLFLSAQKVTYNSLKDIVCIESNKEIYGVTIEQTDINPSYGRSYSNNVLNKEIQGNKTFSIGLDDLKDGKYIVITLQYQLKSVSFVISKELNLNEI